MNPLSALENCSFLLSDLEYCGHMLSVLLLDLFRGRRLRFAAVRQVNITDNDVDSDACGIYFMLLQDSSDYFS